MSIHSTPHRAKISSFTEHRNGASTARCRKASDNELARRILAADDWVLCAPDLRPGSPLPKRLARRIRALRLGLDLPETDWQTGECEQFNLSRERLDLMLEHGREIFLGSTQRIDRDGCTCEIAVVALAPCETSACDIVFDIDQAGYSPLRSSTAAEVRSTS